jgi:hypothetical protein
LGGRIAFWTDLVRVGRDREANNGIWNALANEARTGESLIVCLCTRIESREVARQEEWKKTKVQF